MNGLEHYEAAERLLSDASHSRTAAGGPLRKDGTPFEPGEHAALIARAQVHATLAQTAVAAAQLADPYVGDGDHINAWRHVIGDFPEPAPDRVYVTSYDTGKAVEHVVPGGNHNLRCARCHATDGPFWHCVDGWFCDDCRTKVGA